MSTDAIVLLKKDHQEIRKLFTRSEKAGATRTSPRARSSTRSSRP